jgi:UDP-N-acetylglucosamine 2-epimerase (non-hydrolysing)
MQNYCIVFGTRPEFLKLKSLISEFKINHIPYKVIYIRQHENIEEELDESFLSLSIEQTDIRDRLSHIGSQILLKLPAFIRDDSHVIVQGDTATAFYSTLVAFQMNKQIIHIEAGLRTYNLNKPFPEEGYRQMISRLANIHFTPHIDCITLLHDEKIGGFIKNVGNTILDLIKSYHLTCEMNNIVIITFHRRENWDKIEDLLIGLQKLIVKIPHIRFIWYLHPNPDLQMKVKQSINIFTNSAFRHNAPKGIVELKHSSNHFEFTTQMSKCNFIITDSGGIQEEASFLGKHCIVLRESTERTHIPNNYITILKDYSLLDEIYEQIPKHPLPQCNIYGYGNSSKEIVNYIQGI